MSLALHEISEANHRILDPFTHAQLLVRWARRYLGWGVFLLRPGRA